MNKNPSWQQLRTTSKEWALMKSNSSSSQTFLLHQSCTKKMIKIHCRQRGQQRMMSKRRSKRMEIKVTMVKKDKREQQQQD